MELLFAILDDNGDFNAAALTSQLDIPQSTLFRHLEALVSSGLIVRLRRGVYRPGPGLLKRTASFSVNNILTEIARPILAEVAGELSATVHLGVLEDDMVTYLVKICAVDGSLFTRENEQLEAYCSGLGKVLLAGLSEAERSAYLMEGPFPKLTNKTVTDSELIAEELERTRIRGYAVDAGEVADGLYCLAVPVSIPKTGVIAAISASTNDERSLAGARSGRLEVLLSAASRLSQGLGG